MNHCELCSATKLAFLVIGICLESIVKFGLKCGIVLAFHDKFFLHYLEERLLSSALEKINASLIVYEFNICDYLAWKLAFIEFGCLLKDVLIELLLQLFISIVDAQLLK